jgi:hypothetical protein
MTTTSTPSTGDKATALRLFMTGFTKMYKERAQLPNESRMMQHQRMAMILGKEVSKRTDHIVRVWATYGANDKYTINVMWGSWRHAIEMD